GAQVDLARGHVHAHLAHAVAEGAAVEHRIAEAHRRVDAGGVADQEHALAEVLRAARHRFAPRALPGGEARVLAGVGPGVELAPHRHALAAQAPGRRVAQRRRSARRAAGVEVAADARGLLRRVHALLEVGDPGDVLRRQPALELQV